MNKTTKKKVAQAKRKVKKVAAGAEKNVKKTMEQAQREVAKVKKEMDKSIKKVESFVKKHPERAALISAGIGAALGASIALFMKAKKKKK